MINTAKYIRKIVLFVFFKPSERSHRECRKDKNIFVSEKGCSCQNVKRRFVDVILMEAFWRHYLCTGFWTHLKCVTGPHWTVIRALAGKLALKGNALRCLLSFLSLNLPKHQLHFYLTFLRFSPNLKLNC